jgi:uncharacterized protein YprB with RNaseH-like and TPR domain
MVMAQSPFRAGALWQQRMDTAQEYKVVRDGNILGTKLSDSCICSSEYEKARQQLDMLFDKHRGVPFSEIFSGSEVTNIAGACFHLQSTSPLPVVTFDADRFRQEVLTDLTLVKGIGKITEKRLKARGYTTIPDLMRHPKFRFVTGAVLEDISSGGTLALMGRIGCRHGRSHASVLGTAGFHEPEDLVFLDIETMGLFSRPIILIGIGVIASRKLTVHQYLSRGIAEEQAALFEGLSYLSGNRSALVTFNGRSFDYPYLAERLAYYGMHQAACIPHFDILHFSRRRWKGMFPSMCLGVLEQEVLGIHREGDIPGQMVPEFYDTYMRTGNCGPLVPIVDHNRQDVVSLARLFYLLLGESYGC